MVTTIKSHPIGHLTAKIAILTGSSAGIGRPIALAFAREAKVDIKDEAHVTTHDAITQGGGIGVFVKADVGDAHEVEELVHQAVEIFGRVDMFVNNAIIALEIDSPTPGQPIHLSSIEIHDKTMSVNARGTFLGCKYAIAQMKQGLHPSGDRGWIINCPVLLGWAAAYCSSKSAIAQLTKQVAVDYGKHKIHINAICPGGHRTDLKHQTAIETAMVQPLAGNGAAATTLGAARPWGAFGETRNIAGAAASLASEDAAFVTGVLLPVDGVCC